MWDSLKDIGGSLWEGVSEGVTEYVDGWVDYEQSKRSEAARDPEVLKQIEPTKAKLTDGSTVVATGAPMPADLHQGQSQAAQAQWIAGVDNKIVMGVGAVALILLLKR